MQEKNPLYIEFSRPHWNQFCSEIPLAFNEKLFFQAENSNHFISSFSEIKDIYLPLIRLLTSLIQASNNLHSMMKKSGITAHKTPYLIGITGSVAVGKSQMARMIQTLLSHSEEAPQVALINTDGFLYPNAALKKKQIMRRKGFPESYHLSEFIQCLIALKSGKFDLKIPQYSHEIYDILADTWQSLPSQLDVVIVEGLNVLNIPLEQKNPVSSWIISDFFDFTIYVDASISNIKTWYMDRLMTLRAKARTMPKAYFHPFCHFTEIESKKIAEKTWKEINEVNLIENILPFKHRANLILQKGNDHAVEKIWLRR